MGKVNDQLSYCLNNPNRLADFFNVVVYGEQRIILPQQLADVQKCYQESLLRFLENYHLHVVSLEDLDEDKFETDLREVIGIAKRREDQKALRAYCAAHQDRISNLCGDAYDLICALLNCETLLQNKEYYYNTETEDFNMCKAMNDWEQEALKKGEEKLSTLIRKLSEDNRADDILKAAASVEARHRLYREYSI